MIRAEQPSLDACWLRPGNRIGADQRYRTDRAIWARLLGTDAGDLPIHREWPQLLGALRTMLCWLDRPELVTFSEYLRASQARDLLDDVRPKLAHAGAITATSNGGDRGWEDRIETVERALLVRATGGDSLAVNGRIVAASFARMPPWPARGWLLSGCEATRVHTSTSSTPTMRTTAAGAQSAANGQSVAASAESFASAERAARGARELAASASGPWP